MRDRTNAVRVWHEVDRERERQEFLAEEGKFFETCASPKMPDVARLAVLTEEVGEVAHLLNEEWSTEKKYEADPAMGRSETFKALARKKLREELVQVAVVAVAWLEGLDAEDRR